MGIAARFNALQDTQSNNAGPHDQMDFVVLSISEVGGMQRSGQGFRGGCFCIGDFIPNGQQHCDSLLGNTEIFGIGTNTDTGYAIAEVNSGNWASGSDDFSTEFVAENSALLNQIAQLLEHAVLIGMQI